MVRGCFRRLRNVWQSNPRIGEGGRCGGDHIRNCSTLSMTVGAPLSAATGPANGAHSAFRTSATSRSGPDTVKHTTKQHQSSALSPTWTRERRTIDSHGAPRRSDLLLEDPIYVRPAAPLPERPRALGERERTVRQTLCGGRAARGEVRRIGLLERARAVRDRRIWRARGDGSLTP